MAASLNLRREYLLAVAAAFLVVAIIGTVALVMFFVAQSDAQLANSAVNYMRLGQISAPNAR